MLMAARFPVETIQVSAHVSAHVGECPSAMGGGDTRHGGDGPEHVTLCEGRWTRPHGHVCRTDTATDGTWRMVVSDGGVTVRGARVPSWGDRMFWKER